MAESSIDEGEELRKERSEILSLTVKAERLSEDIVLPVRNEFMLIGWFGFMDKRQRIIVIMILNCMHCARCANERI